MGYKGDMERMKNAVIYARFSSHNQREESIEGQVRECEAYALANDYNVIRVYADRAISGRTDKRPEFQQMLKDSKKKKFTAVIVYSLDRFSRDRYDSAVHKRELKLNGVKLLSAKEHISDDATGVLVESLLEGLAEYYSVELAQKIKRGMTDNALKGRWASGTVPFGYKLNAERKLEIDKETAPAVKQIFELYAQGKPLTKITEIMNQQHYKTNRGNKFTRNSYNRLFDNVAYIGTFRWNDIVIEGGTPQLIDKATFEICRQRHDDAKHGKYNVRPSEHYALSGKLFCGKCGNPMKGVSGKGKGGLYRYYMCSQRRTKKHCGMDIISATYLENAIVNKIIEAIKEENLVEKLLDKMKKMPELAEDKINLNRLKKERSTTQHTIDKLLDNFGANNSLSVKNKILELEQKLVELEGEIAIEEDRINSYPSSAERIIKFVNGLMTIPGEIDKHKDSLIAHMVSKATIKKEQDGNYTILLQLNNSTNNISKSTPKTAQQSHLSDFCSQHARLVARSGRFAKNILYIRNNIWYLSFTLLPKKKQLTSNS